jgi:ABC-type dipeptide/oligopeptide/nickel transport system permease subunit
MAVVGPCLALALLVVAVNLVGDAYIRQLDRSGDTQ